MTDQELMSEIIAKLQTIMNGLKSAHNSNDIYTFKAIVKELAEAIELMEV